MTKKVIAVLLTLIMVFSVNAFAESEDPTLLESMTAEVFAPQSTTPLPYRMYLPEDYSEDKEYSLLLYLHGAGNRGDDNENQISENTNLISRIINGEEITYNGEKIDASKEFIILAPQCPQDIQWVDTDWGVMPDPSYSFSDVAMNKYMKRVIGLMMDVTAKYSVNPDRMYITGLSMGGFGVWDLLMRFPNMWAAAIPMGGAADPTMADTIAHTPVWTFHQYLDGVVSSQGTQNIAKELVKTGAEVKFTAYFDPQHNAWTKGYAEEDMLNWLYSHTKSDNKLKVACVGDSITWGAYWEDTRENNSYPIILQRELGTGFNVQNFGVSATSALKSAVYPYTETGEYKASLEFAPDILMIMFGTNDIKDENWVEGKNNFKSDYKAIIDSYKEINPDVKVYIGIPPQIFKLNVYGERNPEILEKEGIPMIRELAEEIGATPVDFYELYYGKSELFSDFLHPDDEGDIMMAKEVAKAISKDYPIAETASIVDGASDWAVDEVALAVSLGLVPESVQTDYIVNIDREAFCEMVVKMFDAPVSAAKAPFADVDNSAVDMAYALGIVNGVSDTEFNPDASITREEICAMLARAYRKIAIVDEAEFESADFSDKALISAWAIDDVNFINSVGIMKGDAEGTIRPLDNTANEEAILLVLRTYIDANSYGKIK